MFVRFLEAEIEEVITSFFLEKDRKKTRRIES